MFLKTLNLRHSILDHMGFNFFNVYVVQDWVYLSLLFTDCYRLKRRFLLWRLLKIIFQSIALHSINNLFNGNSTIRFDPNRSGEAVWRSSTHATLNKYSLCNIRNYWNALQPITVCELLNKSIKWSTLYCVCRNCLSLQKTKPILKNSPDYLQSCSSTSLSLQDQLSFILVSAILWSN